MHRQFQIHLDLFFVEPPSIFFTKLCISSTNSSILFNLVSCSALRAMPCSFFSFNSRMSLNFLRKARSLFSSDVRTFLVSPTSRSFRSLLLIRVTRRSDIFVFLSALRCSLIRNLALGRVSTRFVRMVLVVVCGIWLLGDLNTLTATIILLQCIRKSKGVQMAPRTWCRMVIIHWRLVPHRATNPLPTGCNNLLTPSSIDRILFLKRPLIKPT